jgi:site-specific recombinase XerD
MASISFFLKDNNTSKKTRVIAKLTDGRNIQIRISTNHSVFPKHWSKTNNNVLSAESNSAAINRDLKQLKEKILEIYTDAKINGIIATKEYITDILKPKEVAKVVDNDFWNLFNVFCNEKEYQTATGTQQKYQTLKKHLTGFEAKRNISIKFDQITVKMLNEFNSYLIEKGLNQNSASKNIKIFKVFLNWTILNKYNKSMEFKDFKAKGTPDTLKPVFSENDLSKLRSFNHPEKNYLNNVRDLLLLSCLTGLRYSDYSKISKEHLIKLNETTYNLRMMQQKTSDYVEIPLTVEAYEIINSLIEGNLRPISNQKINTYVKELCMLSEINEPFEKIEFKQNLRVSKNVPKYEIITSHTGRRTFATNLLLKGVAAEIVMEFTGHKDYKSFSKYVNIPKETKMELVRNALVG